MTAPYCVIWKNRVLLIDVTTFVNQALERGEDATAIARLLMECLPTTQTYTASRGEISSES